nr:hypothetical protein [Tanacetum cinerariifolium]
MLTQQDIYAAGSESRPPMLNKENYVPLLSRLLRYAKNRPNGKLIHNSILNGPYVRRMIPEPGDANREITVTKTFHLQTDDELSDKELKHIETDDQAIQTILLGLPEDIYAAANQNGVDTLLLFIRPRTCTQLITLNYPTTVINMAFALMAKAFKLNYSTPTNNNQKISSNPRNRQIAQPGMNMGQDKQMEMVGGNGGNQFRKYAGQNAGNPTGYNDVIRNQVIQNAVQNLRVQNVGNQNGLIGVQRNENQNQIRNGNLVEARAEGNAVGQNGNQIRLRRRDAAYLQTQLLIAQKKESGIQLQAEEYDLMAAAADLDEIEEVNANYILMATLQQASTLGTQSDSAPVYDTDGSAEVHENFDDNEIFNMFTQEEQYTELLEPIPESHQVPHNDSDVISEDTSVEQGGKTIEQHPVLSFHYSILLRCLERRHLVRDANSIKETEEEL